MKKSSILPFLLALGVVGGALWIADYSIRQKQVLNERAAGAQDSASDLSRNPDTIHQPINPPVRATDAPKVESGILKCVINGKVIYSNEGCPQGAKPVEVRLHDSKGIVSPPKELLGDLEQKRAARERAYQNEVRQVTLANQGKPSKTEQCDMLSKEIISLDAMARLPQSGQMQDWIRGKRQNARDQQFRIGC